MSGKFAEVGKVEFGWWVSGSSWTVGPQVERYRNHWIVSLFAFCLELYVTWPCKRRAAGLSGTFVPDRDTRGTAHR